MERGKKIEMQEQAKTDLGVHLCNTASRPPGPVFSGFAFSKTSLTTSSPRGHLRIAFAAKGRHFPLEVTLEGGANSN
ncbi:MAG: hypothetical protein P0S96_02230 [Simkaniaceae bacterium]|nr:hypothetical protein [Candidatus Sacchlamyda saccharinae]